jgi:hypothetical protein
VATLKFTTIIKIRGANPYVDVSKKQAGRLRTAWRKPMPVLARVNGQPKAPWHVNMIPVGNGAFYLYLHGNVRKVSGTKVGDKVLIEIDFDHDYRNGPLHAMPEQLALTLEQNLIAMKNWDKLPPSRQKEILRYLAGLKSSEAKERNIKRAMAVLSGSPERFMGRSWQNGS